MPAKVPERAVIRAAMESGKLQLVDDPTDPWFGTHAKVGDRAEVRYTNTVVVRTRGLTVDMQKLWAAPVSDGEGGLVPHSAAVVFGTKRARDADEEGDADANANADPQDEPEPVPVPNGKARRSPAPASRAQGGSSVPAHVPSSRFELWQITLPDRTRGCLPPNRRPAARQFKKTVSLHVWTGDSLPNVRLSQEGSIHIAGCLHIGLVREIVQFLHTLPGISFAADTPFFVDTVLTNVRFSLGYEVDRWRLRWLVNDRTAENWSAIYDAQSDHVAVSISCRTDAPLDQQSPIPCFTLADGWKIGRVADMCDLMRTGAQPRRKAPRHTFRVFANGTVTFACVWPPELEAMHARFTALMSQLRQDVQFVGSPDRAAVVN